MGKSMTLAERIGMILSDPVQRATMEKVLAAHGLTLGVAAPLEPTDAMISASMAAVNSRMSLVSKREKHTLRLRAALAVLYMKAGAI